MNILIIMCILTHDFAENCKIQKTESHIILAPRENVKFWEILFLLYKHTI